MSAKTQHPALAGDGLPAVDVIELATAILSQGSVKETMVSQREIRAMALALIDFNGALTTASLLVFIIEACGARPDSKDLQREGTRLVTELRAKLVELDFYDWEERLGHSS